MEASCPSVILRLLVFNPAQPMLRQQVLLCNLQFFLSQLALGVNDFHTSSNGLGIYASSFAVVTAWHGKVLWLFQNVIF